MNGEMNGMGILRRVLGSALQARRITTAAAADAIARYEDFLGEARR